MKAIQLIYLFTSIILLIYWYRDLKYQLNRREEYPKTEIKNETENNDQKQSATPRSKNDNSTAIYDWRYFKEFRMVKNDPDFLSYYEEAWIEKFKFIKQSIDDIRRSKQLYILSKERDSMVLIFEDVKFEENDTLLKLQKYRLRVRQQSQPDKWGGYQYIDFKYGTHKPATYFKVNISRTDNQIETLDFEPNDAQELFNFISGFPIIKNGYTHLFHDSNTRLFLVERFLKTHQGSLESNDHLIEHDDSLFKIQELSTKQTRYYVSGGMTFKMRNYQTAYAQFEQQMKAFENVRADIITLEQKLVQF